jgi:hypothetical protein
MGVHRYRPVIKTLHFACARCAARSSHSDRAEFILKIFGDQESFASQIPAMTPELRKQKMEK